MSQILLLVENRENRRLLSDWLQAYYTVALAESAEDVKGEFDCMIADGVMANRCEEAITRCKREAEPLFLPILLITPRQDVRLMSNNLWRTFDELIFTPVEKIELLARVEILLRSRRHTLLLHQMNASLQAEIAARQSAQALVETLLQSETRARRQAEEADRLKLKFLGMVSHELRTPLTSIKGFASSLMATDVQFSEDQQLNFIRIISEEADRLTDLIEQLLDLSRLQAGTLRIDPHAEAVDSLLQSAMPRLQMVADQHPLIVDLARDLPLVWCDSVRIAQVIVNLVDNAAKFSPSGSDIVLSFSQQGDQMLVRVIDHGSGIAPGERTSVFEPFRQADSPARHKGAGLGLAICKGIIEAHGGAILVDANPAGVGTVVSFTLPRYQSPGNP